MDAAVAVVNGRRYVFGSPAPIVDDDWVLGQVEVMRGYGPRTQSAADVESSDRPGGNKRARVAASAEAIRVLQEVTPGGDAKLLQAECAVCLRDFDAEDRFRAMPCSHAFHQDCIFQWLRRNAVCALCRHPLPTPGGKETASQ